VLFAFLLACRAPTENLPPKPEGDSTAPPTETGSAGASSPVVVYWTVDTLSAPAAEETGFCGAIGLVAARYGLDVGCLDRAVSTSSWTGESHTRLLWPEHTVGEGARLGAPECGERSVLVQIASAHRASYHVGLDNPFFHNLSIADTCTDGSTPWTQGADAAWTIDQEKVVVEDVPEEERPAHLAIDALLAETATGRSAVAFLNTYEAGGHKPRCWFDPDLPACHQLYQLGLDAGAAHLDDDPAEKWREYAVMRTIVAESQRVYADDPATLRGLWFETITGQVGAFRPTFVDDRLDRILAGLQEQGRLRDLVLVMLADHGENVSNTNLLTGKFQMYHSDLPTEYTAEVPVLTIPAALATEMQDRGLVGDGSQVWSTPNLAWGLLQHFELGVPDTWPEPEPPGQARSWECLVNPSGVRIEGEQSVRCDGGVCGAWTWTRPGALAEDPVPIDPIPDELATWADPDGPAPWFGTGCSG